MMKFTGTTVLKLKDGKIVEEIGLDDGVAALTQLGLIKTTASGGFLNVTNSGLAFSGGGRPYVCFLHLTDMGRPPNVCFAPEADIQSRPDFDPQATAAKPDP